MQGSVVFLKQIVLSNGVFLPVSIILVFFLIALFCILAYLIIYKKWFQTNQLLKAELNSFKLREKEILEAVTFQQVSVTKIGETIQTIIAQEFELQNSSLFETDSNTERRETSKSSWHKVLELSERLAHFTLRNVQRKENGHTVNSESVFAENQAMLMSIVNAKQQQLHYVKCGHALLNLPVGALDKIVRGIIFHASKAADPNTTLCLSCDLAQASFNFSIRGWGKGISAQEIHNINVSVRTNPRFHFAKRAQDNEGDLNLASVRRLVMQFGGSVKIASGLGYGTAIYVSLPILACSVSNYVVPTSLSLPFTEQQTLLGNAKHNVLIIDQNETSQIILHRALQKNYGCYACTSPLESMQMIRHLQPSVILIDQMLQDIECLELIKLIRENPLTQSIPIVVCCGIAAQSFKLSVLSVGASHLIEKPIVQKELELTLKGLIQQQYLVAEKVGEKLSEYHSQQLDVPEPGAVGSGKDKEFIIRFNDMMDENYSNEGFTREIAADHMNVCLRTLNRRLSEHYSHNFKEHLKKYRLKKAKSLLSKGYTINEASFEVGFNSASYFSTCFKAEYGFSPSRIVTRCA
ncbi:MAG: AraC-like DNA-binding protein/signal transduction histidine kinase [Glaciecola sp.]